MKIKVGGNKAAYDRRMREAELPTYEEFLEAFLSDKRGSPQAMTTMLNRVQTAFSKRPRSPEK